MKVLEHYQEVFKSDYDFSSDKIKAHINHLQQLDLLLPPSTTFLMITNTLEARYDFISKNFEYATGLERTLFMELGIPHFLSIIHPDEINIWLDMLQELMTFCMTEYSPEDRYRLDFQYNYRLRTSAETYINVLENQLAILNDENGKPVVGLGHFTVFGEGQDLPLRATIRLLNKDNHYETVFQKIYGLRQIGHRLTNRERDVLRLIALGETNEEIAARLNISIHTVLTHRKNMLEKSGSKNTAQLLVDAIREGWL
jgi:DNA-binding CsgD family transcriptional regulator